MAWYWAAFAVGVITCLGTSLSVVGTLVVPRRVHARVSRLVASGIIKGFRAIARLSASYDTRDRILAFQGPMFMVVLLAVWVACYVVGYALMALPFLGDHAIGGALLISGSSFFTLGFAEHSASVPWLAFIAAATGLVVVALQIAYLPVIYAAFNRRETLVTMLDSRAGSPAWGPEILARAELVDNVENLENLYSRWEEWTADLAETHANYPVLIWLRSPQPMRSWVTGLLAVMDAAALHLATRPLTAPPAARVMIRMGYVTLRDMAQMLDIPVNDDPKPDDPIELTRRDFDDALHHLAHVHWPMERDADEAWVHFRGWRVNYEALAYALADTVDAPPALWSGPRHHLPDGLQPPPRPPHREPTPQTRQIGLETKRRRAARGHVPSAPAAPLEQFHDREHDGDEAGDRRGAGGAGEPGGVTEG